MIFSSAFVSDGNSTCQRFLAKNRASSGAWATEYIRFGGLNRSTLSLQVAGLMQCFLEHRKIALAEDPLTANSMCFGVLALFADAAHLPLLTLDTTSYVTRSETMWIVPDRPK